MINVFFCNVTKNSFDINVNFDFVYSVSKPFRMTVSSRVCKHIHIYIFLFWNFGISVSVNKMSFLLINTLPFQILFVVVEDYLSFVYETLSVSQLLVTFDFKIKKLFNDLQSYMMETTFIIFVSICLLIIDINISENNSAQVLYGIDVLETDSSTKNLDFLFSQSIFCFLNLR